MNEVTLLRTQQINDFISKFDDLKNVNVDEIKEGLKEILGGETPGIDFEYGVDFQLNESSGEEDRVEELKKIHIYYTYFENDTNVPKIGKISYVVG